MFQPLNAILQEMMADNSDWHSLAHPSKNSTLHGLLPAGLDSLALRSLELVEILDSEISVFLPPLNPCVTEDLQTQMAQLFGGFSCFQVAGGWISPTNQLITEEILLITSLTSQKVILKSLGLFLVKIVEIGRTLKQESILTQLRVQSTTVHLLLPIF